MNNKFIHGSTSHKDSAGEFCCAGPTFLTKLSGLMSKAIKLLLTELVGSVQEYIQSINTEKAVGGTFLHWSPTQLMRV